MSQAYPIGPAIPTVGATVTLKNDFFIDRVETANELGVAREIAPVTDVSSSVVLSSNCGKIRVTCHGSPVRFRIGVGPQTAVSTDHYIHTDQQFLLRVPYGATVAAVRHAANNGQLYISELI